MPSTETSPEPAAAVLARQRAVMSLGVFLLAQAVGLFLRALPLLPLAVNYTHVLYGHTHVALSGWIQGLFYLALIQLLPERMRQKRTYTVIWRLNLFGSLGMLIAFPIQGYKAVSIALSSGVILVSYAFAWRLWRDSRELRHQPAWRCIRISLLFLALSSLGPWSLGALMVKLPGSDWIQLAVYYYLHFLYNGFFSFALLGLLLHWGTPEGRTRLPFWPIGLLAIACLPAYALSALWVDPPAWVWALGAMAAVLQMIALAGLLPVINSLWRQLALTSWPRLLLGVSLACFSTKLGMQALSALPPIAAPLSQNRYLIIGYLHLVFLGMISCFLFAWLLDHKLLNSSGPGLSLLLAGIASSEALLFGAATAAWLSWGELPGFSLLMLLCSALMPLGTAWLLSVQRPVRPVPAQA